MDSPASKAAVFAFFQRNYDPQGHRVRIGTCYCALDTAVYATLEQLPGDIRLVCGQAQKHRWQADEVHLDDSLVGYKLKKELRAALDSWVDLGNFLPSSGPLMVGSVAMSAPTDAEDGGDESADLTIGATAATITTVAQVPPQHTIIVGNGDKTNAGATQYVHAITHITKNILYHYGPFVAADSITLYLAARNGDSRRLHITLANMLPKYFPEYLRTSAALPVVELLHDVITGNLGFDKELGKIQERWQKKWAWNGDPMASLSPRPFVPAAEDTSKQIMQLRSSRSARGAASKQ